MIRIKKLYTIFALISFFAVPQNTFSQLTGNDRGNAMVILDTVKDAIKKNYFDSTFHGIDIDFVFEQAKERLKVAPNRDALMMTVASAVVTFDDSHTFFLPPARAAAIEYGWLVGMVGNDCYVLHIKPGSDAEAKGLKVGDRVLAIDGWKPVRKAMWQMNYRYFAVEPRAIVNMTVLSPGDEKPHSLTINTKITKTGTVISLRDYYDRGVLKKGWFDTKKLNEFAEFGNDLLVWKMHTFANSEQSVDFAMGKAKKFKTLIVDLRGNGGGYVDTLRRLVGHVFDKDIKICDQKMRKETKPQIAKTQGNDTFKGSLIVLVDHDSGSASELFARVIQLEGRGKVIGDQSAGAVMESRFFDLQTGLTETLYFGASVTVADLIMSDGKSLEKTGVIPDETVLPTGKDLADTKDPVLSYAAKLAGVDLSPEKAGLLFPFEWPKA